MDNDYVHLFWTVNALHVPTYDELACPHQVSKLVGLHPGQHLVCLWREEVDHLWDLDHRQCIGLTWIVLEK